MSSPCHLNVLPDIFDVIIKRIVAFLGDFSSFFQFVTPRFTDVD